jgi:RIO-like serine/threonine protein kinase
MLNTFWTVCGELVIKYSDQIFYFLKTYHIQILYGVILLLIFVFFKKNIFSKIPNKLSNKVSTQKKINLTESQQLIMAFLYNIDGRYVSLKDIASNTKLSNLEAEHSLKFLVNLDFVYDRYNMVHGVSYRISPNGYEFIKNLH